MALLPRWQVLAQPASVTEGIKCDGGPADAAELNGPNRIAVDTTGNLYIVDGYNCRIRKATTTGIITTIAGNGTAGYCGDGGQLSKPNLNIRAVLP